MPEALDTIIQKSPGLQGVPPASRGAISRLLQGGWFMIASLCRRGLMIVAFAGLAVGAMLLGRGVPASGADRAAPNKEAVDRARATVQMLDDLYKGYVVHITDTYVKARESKPAASVTKKVFKHMEAKGWHT